MTRRSKTELAALVAGSLVGLHACAGAPPSNPAPTVPEPMPTIATLVDDRCTVVALRHDSGVQETLCLTAGDLQRAYDQRAGRCK